MCYAEEPLASGTLQVAEELRTSVTRHAKPSWWGRTPFCTRLQLALLYRSRLPPMLVLCIVLASRRAVSSIVVVAATAKHASSLALVIMT